MSIAFHETTPERIAQLHAVRDRMKGDAAVTQRQRLLVALQALGSLTTFEAMRHLDIFDPRPRKLELVADGVPIVMVWRLSETESGDRHRVGLYVMDRTAPLPVKE